MPSTASVDMIALAKMNLTGVDIGTGMVVCAIQDAEHEGSASTRVPSGGARVPP